MDQSIRYSAIHHIRSISWLLETGQREFGVKSFNHIQSCKPDITVHTSRMDAGHRHALGSSSSQGLMGSLTYGISTIVKMKWHILRRSLIQSSRALRLQDLWLLLEMKMEQYRWSACARHCGILSCSRERRKLWLPSSIEKHVERRCFIQIKSKPWSKSRSRNRRSAWRKLLRN